MAAQNVILMDIAIISTCIPTSHHSPPDKDWLSKNGAQMVFNYHPFINKYFIHCIRVVNTGEACKISLTANDNNPTRKELLIIWMNSLGFQSI